MLTSASLEPFIRGGNKDRNEEDTTDVEEELRRL